MMYKYILYYIYQHYIYNKYYIYIYYIFIIYCYTITKYDNILLIWSYITSVKLPIFVLMTCIHGFDIYWNDY